MKRGLRNLASWVIASVILAPVVLGTSPRPAPYNEYVVSGIIFRQDGRSAPNVVVSVVGKWDNFIDSVIDLRGSAIRYESLKSVAVTDLNGSYSLDIQMDLRPDSVAIMVNALDRPMSISRFYPVPSTREEIVQVEAAQMSGCRGCETVTPAENHVAGHKYRVVIETALPY
jgi:hypothetical protein